MTLEEELNAYGDHCKAVLDAIWAARPHSRYYKITGVRETCNVGNLPSLQGQELTEAFRKSVDEVN